MNKEELKKIDPEIYELISLERKRREDSLEMIPSENHTSPAVLESLNSILNDKYAEGYPGKRYYGGNEYIDKVELLCQKRVKDIFKVPHVNVQPYSGSPANHAVYMALLNPGDKNLGMRLPDGGHLTHGWKVSFSGIYYNSLFYGVKESDHRIDYDEVEEIAKKEKPKLIWVGASAYPRDIDFKKFGEIAKKTGAYLCADIAHIAGLIIAKAHSNPVPYVDIITTTTHKTLRGPRGGLIMVTENGLKKDPDLAKKIDKAVFPGLQGGPHEHQIAGIAVCLKEAKEESFKIYGKKVVENAKVLAKELKEKGFNLITGGTDNHLILIDLQNKNISGKEAEDLLEKAGITVNKNSIPFDPASPFNPSGIRMGTPAITTRGMEKEEMKKIASFIERAIEGEDPKKIKEEVKKLCLDFPIP